MNVISIHLMIAIAFCSSTLFGQPINFKEGYRKANPVQQGQDLSLEETIQIHEGYLEEAVQMQDVEKQIYGFLYLFTDYLRLQDYPGATRQILEAEKLALREKNPGWLGILAHVKGVVSVRMKDYAAALPHYEEAALRCAEARDSLCLAESLEQIAAMNMRLGHFDLAKQYFEQAIPLLEIYGQETSVATSLNNMGLFYFDQEQYEVSVDYFKQAIEKYRSHQYVKEEAQAMNNLAAALLNLERYAEAQMIYDQCLLLNTEQGLFDNIMTNYSGLANLYEEKGDLKNALVYLVKYYDLRDSLIGSDTEKEIADLETEYASQQKELDLEKSRTALETSQSTVERLFMFIVFILLLAGFGIWRWKIQASHAKQALEQNQQTLSEITRVLIDKNHQLKEMNAHVETSQTAEADHSLENIELDENLYNQRILTQADWEAFKRVFEKGYPGYLRRLRDTYPTLSEAEERLFLFIKLNLTSRESAAILGISLDSVKKTRNRLRHRLALDEETELDGFIRVFESA